MTYVFIYPSGIKSASNTHAKPSRRTIRQTYSYRGNSTKQAPEI